MERTPDEIKKGLELCALSYAKCVSKCPYAGDDCVERLVTDAIDLIQIHEESIEKKNNGIVELVRIIKQLEAERDAAVEDVHGHCSSCKDYDKDPKEEPCVSCLSAFGNKDNWQWRGVQKEDNGENT